MARKDLLTRLADAGEEALNRLTDGATVDRMTAFATSTRDRLDELTKRVRGYRLARGPRRQAREAGGGTVRLEILPRPQEAERGEALRREKNIELGSRST